MPERALFTPLGPVIVSEGTAREAVIFGTVLSIPATGANVAAFSGVGAVAFVGASTASSVLVTSGSTVLSFVAGSLASGVLASSGASAPTFVGAAAATGIGTMAGTGAAAFGSLGASIATMAGGGFMDVVALNANALTADWMIHKRRRA